MFYFNSLYVCCFNPSLNACLGTHGLHNNCSIALVIFTELPLLQLQNTGFPVSFTLYECLPHFESLHHYALYIAAPDKSRRKRTLLPMFNNIPTLHFIHHT